MKLFKSLEEEEDKEEEEEEEDEDETFLVFISWEQTFCCVALCRRL